MSEYLVGICIPVYEDLILVKKLLDSIKRQTYKDYLVFINDDSITNDIRDYILSLDDKQIVYKKNEIKRGPSGNVNEAIKNALNHKVDYIKIMFQDDCFSFADSLERMMKRIISTNADVVFSANFEEYKDHSIKRIPSQSDIQEIENELASLYRGNVLGAPSTILYKTAEVFFDSNYVWLLDVDFYLKLLRNRKLEYIYEPLISIGHFGNQLTDYYRKHDFEMYSETLRLFFKYSFLNNKKNRRYLLYMTRIIIKESLKRNE